MKENNEERVALITGSGKGVGAGIIRVLTSHGIKCCIHCNSNKAMAEELLQKVTEAGGEAFLYQADVSHPEEIHNLVQAVIEKYGRLDIVVNNAAMQPNLFIDGYTKESFKKLWDINIGGYVRVVQEALPYLKQSPSARIVNISSVHGKRPTTFDAGYSMTKGAIRMFTRELNTELLADNIPVNTVDLGACQIEFKTGNAQWKTVSPLEVYNPDVKYSHRTVYPEEVGELIYYLASNAGSAIEGAGIRIDRGLVLI